MNEQIIQLQTLKKTCNDGAIEVICDVLIQLIREKDTGKFGFGVGITTTVPAINPDVKPWTTINTGRQM